MSLHHRFHQLRRSHIARSRSLLAFVPSSGWTISNFLLNKILGHRRKVRHFNFFPHSIAPLASSNWRLCLCKDKHGKKEEWVINYSVWFKCLCVRVCLTFRFEIKNARKLSRMISTHQRFISSGILYLSLRHFRSSSRADRITNKNMCL